jgi:hypothetical protein
LRLSRTTSAVEETGLSNPNILCWLLPVQVVGNSDRDPVIVRGGLKESCFAPSTSLLLTTVLCPAARPAPWESRQPTTAPLRSPFPSLRPRPCAGGIFSSLPLSHGRAQKAAPAPDRLRRVAIFC